MMYVCFFLFLTNKNVNNFHHSHRFLLLEFHLLNATATTPCRLMKAVVIVEIPHHVTDLVEVEPNRFKVPWSKRHFRCSPEGGGDRIYFITHFSHLLGASMPGNRGEVGGLDAAAGGTRQVVLFLIPGWLRQLLIQLCIRSYSR